MQSNNDDRGSGSAWFGGAYNASTNKDQTERFIQDGIWENGTGKYLDTVKSIKPGDRIAIKSSYTRKNGLPFDNHGNSVSVMLIKAIGIVKENLDDGRVVKVDWEPLGPTREWYFSTSQSTIWRVSPSDWMSTNLIDFAFNGEPQDIELFLSQAPWKERYGNVSGSLRFGWTKFYEAIADRLLEHKENRNLLVSELHAISNRVNGFSIALDQYRDGTTRPLQDICPFTVMGIFNRGITDKNRKDIAKELAKFLGVEESLPEFFQGVPVLNNQRAWFFAFDKDRQPDDIDVLWEIFESALKYSTSKDDEARQLFVDSFDKANENWGVGWNLTMGLYWMRPWEFPTLDSLSQTFIRNELGIEFGLNGSKNRCSGDDYINLMSSLESVFQDTNYEVSSYPELSLAAWNKGQKTIKTIEEEGLDDPEVSPPSIKPAYSPIDFETIVNAVKSSGLVISDRLLRRFHVSIQSKGFVILSGISGTGKTWLAQEYAKAVKGESLLVPVAPNWTTNEDLLGYQNPLDDKFHHTPFSRFLEEASDEWKSSEESGNLSTPYFLILDEMNLARIEYYFALFLSKLEVMHRDGPTPIELGNRTVNLTPNLKVVGTVNVDETTQMFSDKVYDRGQLIELEINREDMKNFVGDAEFSEVLLNVWDVVLPVAPFAYRVVAEIKSYCNIATRLGATVDEALDEQLLQKVLPKIKGMDPRVKGCLEKLNEITAERFPYTNAKAKLMLNLFDQNGFTSYFS